jgi:hypothetical protein
MDRNTFTGKLNDAGISCTHTLFHKDIPVLAFSHGRAEVFSAVLPEENIPHLPLSLKRITNFQEEFVERKTGDILVLNEEGAVLVDAYLSDREVPSNRNSLDKYISRGHTARQWMLNNHSMSFTDCYWTDTTDGCMTWEGIQGQMNDLDEFSVVRDSNRYTGHNSTLGGELEKFWYREDGELSLCKKTSPLNGILSVRETIASLVYKRQDFPACQYSLIRNKGNEVAGCRCAAFTDVRTELITAYDLLEEHNMTQQDDVYELIAAYAADYGLPEKHALAYLDMQTLVDFIILNRDRHMGNIGFLRDPDTLRIISPAPVYDSGSSARMEGELPDHGLATTVNGLYPTFGECLAHINDPCILDLTRLPDAKELGRLMDQAGNIPASRKEKLLQTYEEHKQIIRSKDGCNVGNK